MSIIQSKGTTRQDEITLLTGDVSELLERSTRDEVPETEASQDLALMQENTAAHLTAPICKLLLGNPDDKATINVVLVHLCRCSWCRVTLYEALKLCDKDATHPLYVLLEEAEEWARWEAAGKQATQTARQNLREQGINSVYARDGAIIEEHPDGIVNRVAEVMTLGTPSR